MKTSSLPKYFIDSFVALSNISLKSFSSFTILIPRPPPPKAAFIITGNPISRAIFSPSLILSTGSSVPSKTGTPTFFIATFEAILSPKSSICSGFGPIKMIPLSSHAFAKSAFSLKNP